MISKAKTVKEYLASLPEDRRKEIEAVRRVILKNLDKDYEEGMQYGAISYYVPHAVYPNGYHCDPKIPLPFAGLGWQKNHMSLGIMCHYSDGAEDSWFRAAWIKTGKKLDMGKCCIRFKRVEDVPLEVIGEAVRRVPAKKFIAMYEKILGPERLAKINGKAQGGKGGAKGEARGGGKASVAKRKAASKKRTAAAAR